VRAVECGVFEDTCSELRCQLDAILFNSMEHKVELLEDLLLISLPLQEAKLADEFQLGLVLGHVVRGGVELEVPSLLEQVLDLVFPLLELGFEPGVFLVGDEVVEALVLRHLAFDCPRVIFLDFVSDLVSSILELLESCSCFLHLGGDLGSVLLNVGLGELVPHPATSLQVFECLLSI